MKGPGREQRELMLKIFILSAAFLIPALAALAVFASYGFAPFGEQSMLIMDMSGQYVEFLTALRTVRSPADFFFNWGKVLGGNYTGVFAYYASSPLSWLVLFFPDAMMPSAVLFLTVLKIGLSGFTMSLFLRRVLKRLGRNVNSLCVPLFSTLYALCSYNCVYSMCVMWLDGVFMLPLILYFTEELIDSGKIAGLTASLAYIFIANYYVAFMCSVFTVLYYAFYLVDRRPGKAEAAVERSVKTRLYFNRARKFATAFLLAAGLTAWLWLPTLFSLIEGKIGNSNSDYPSNFNYGLEEFTRKLFIGEYDNITNTGAPFFYGGMAVFFGVPAFFLNRRIKAKKRVAALILLLFLVFSTYFSALDKAWHIFQHPNWFPYRWTFVLSFFCVFLAFRAAVNYRGIRPGYYAGAIIGMFGLCLTRTGSKGARIQILLTLSFALGLLLCGLLSRRLRRRAKLFPAVAASVLSVAVLAATVYEMNFHWKGILEGLDGAHRYETAASYVEYRKDMSEALEVVYKDREASGLTGFSGIGQNFSRSFNEAIGFGYRSVSHYSSAFNRHVNEFLGNLGYSQAYLWNLDFGATAVTDSLLGIGYMLSGSGIPAWDKEGLVEIGSVVSPFEYEYLGRAGDNFDINIYKNPYAIKGPFVAACDLTAFSWQRNCFESQNYLMKLASGTEKDAFTEIDAGRIEIKLSPGVKEKTDEAGAYSGGGTLTYEIQMPSGGTLYAYFGRNRNKGAKLAVSKEDRDSLTLYRGETNCIQRIGTYEPGETAVFTLTIGGSVLYTTDNIFYELDTAVLKEQTDAVNSRAITITGFGTGYIEGDFGTPSEGGTMLIPVSYDPGWTVKADGKKVAVSALKDGLLLAEIPAGTTHVSVRYSAKGLGPGLALSLATAFFCAIGIAIHVKRKKRRENKYGPVREAA